MAEPLLYSGAVAYSLAKYPRGSCRRIATVLLTFSIAAPGIAAAANGHRHAAASAASAASRVRQYKLDDELAARSNRTSGKTRVIVTLQPGAVLPPEFAQFTHSRRIGILNAHVVELPNRLLKLLAAHPSIFRIHYDRPTSGADYRTSVTIGARQVQSLLGYSGAGIGVAVVDSGIAFHDDLMQLSGPSTSPFGNQRLAAFVDFVNGQLAPYDDNGHGTHVAGIIAGNGYDSAGHNAGVAPDTTLVSLKVLDANGQGSISHIIAALDWVFANKDAYNIRVVNLSAGATVRESYLTDPLALAAKRLVDAGIVVVAAAGNMGRTVAGAPQYGGITAPANAPWVLTVGASTTLGTPSRTDDAVATYSSRGPTYLDYSAKPDIVAPGTGVVSLAAPGSLFYTSRQDFLIPGASPSAFLPYLSLSGTSMAAPVVSGTVALMLQANPTLTPNAVKAILEYTAQTYAGYDALTQGAGFLNDVGAVRLARFFATAQPGDVVPIQAMWSRHVLWGNHMVSGGLVAPDANAWKLGVTWGVFATDAGDNIVWGNGCGDSCDNIVWGNVAAQNIVWGNLARDNIVWGNTALDNDNIVWGNDCAGADCAGVVWGTIDSVDNIVWGNISAGDNIVWGNAGLLDNIVWSNAAADQDNMVWQSAADDNIVWGNTVEASGWSDPTTGLVWTSGMGDLPAWLTDQQVYDQFLAAATTNDPMLVVDPDGSSAPQPTSTTLDATVLTIDTTTMPAIAPTSVTDTTTSTDTTSTSPTSTTTTTTSTTTTTTTTPTTTTTTTPSVPGGGL